MIVELYNTKDSNNVINKTKTDLTSYDIKFKDVADIQNPTIILRSETPIKNNYAYIPDFDRYYFIDSISIQPNKIYHLNLTVDVLESFKDDILNSMGTIIRKENSNKYYDNDYMNEIRKEHIIYKSDVQLELENNILMVVLE